MARHIPIPGPVRQPSSMVKHGTNVRPSTASGYIETHESFYMTHLIDAKETLEFQIARPVTALGNNNQTIATDSVQRISSAFQKRSRSPRAEEKSQAQQRRPTIDRTDHLDIIHEYFLKRIEHDKIGSLLEGKVEEMIDLTILQDIKKVFAYKKYNEGMPLDDFKREIQELLGIPIHKMKQIDALFQKIDWSSKGKINWDEFCTYMQLEFEEKELQYNKDKNIHFIIPPRIQNTIHRDTVVKILGLNDGGFACASSDGLISFWSSQLEPKKSRSIILPEQSLQRNKQKWITYFNIVNEYTKIIVTTGDREIEFFELSNFEPYCKISSLPSLPLNLDYCFSKTNTDECTLFWGDEDGCVNILTIFATGESLRTWKKKPKSEGISTISLEQVLGQSDIEYNRWKVHHDWVSQLKYDEHLRQIISCSNDEETALVIGSSSGSTYTETDTAYKTSQTKNVTNKFTMISQLSQPRLRKPTDETIFVVHKGVRTFDISKQKNILITGGMDRVIRIWNPYVNSKPIGQLQGHNAPIVYVSISPDDNRLFTVFHDKCIEVYDILDQNRLLAIRPKKHKIRGDLQGHFYNSISKALMMSTTDVLATLNIKQKQSVHADIPLSHKEPVTCAIYNPTFKHVITASENSLIKIWEVENGKKFFEFTGYEDTAVMCMTMDFTGRRLITGSRSGIIKIWNYNNGHCLRELHRKLNYDINGRNEITSVKYVEISKNKFIIGVGWDRRINLFPDDTEDEVHHIQYPIAHWKDDTKRGHKEDILCVATCPPYHMATSSYDGYIIVWNIVSGHVYTKLNPTAAPKKYKDECLDGDLSVAKIAFLKTRVHLRDAAILVASGPRGFIHFWNIHNGGRLFSQFQCHHEEGHMISSLVVDEEDKMLVTGDKFGFLCIWNIEHYAINGPEDKCPELVHRWRAHTQMITEVSIITLIQNRTFLASSSLDYTVRMWTPQLGEYVGTFGQDKEWNLYEQDSFEHPQVPYDVLIDPKSIPSIDHVPKSKHIEETIHKEILSDDENEIPQTPSILGHKQQILIDDTDIKKMIDSKSYENGKGKRLRNERLRPRVVDRGGPSEFQTLRYFELNTPPVDYIPVIKQKSKKENPYAVFEVAAKQS